jgi:hypothetical protein
LPRDDAVSDTDNRIGTAFRRAFNPPKSTLRNKKSVGRPKSRVLARGRVDFGHWAVVQEGASVGGAAIQGSGTERTEEPLLAVYTPVSAIDARLRIRFKLIDGSMPSAGIALRVTSPDAYYLVRASAFEQRLSLLHVVHGTPEEIASVDAEIAQDHWQTLEVVVNGNAFTMSLDDQWALTAFDYRKLVGGRFGIWTEKDDVARFDQIEISPLTSGYERSGFEGRGSGG